MRSFSIPALLSALAAFAALFSVVRGDSPVDLGKAGAFAILAGSTVTSTGTVGTIITGDIGVFPGSAVTGFPPAIVKGAIATYGAAGDAQGDLTTAYNALAGKAVTTTLSNQDLGGMTLIPGVYKFDETASMNGILTLDAQGNSNAIWTFQIGSSLLVAQSSSIIFRNSIGNPDYVYWQVGTTATIAVGVPMVGNILALNAIILNDGVTVSGRCLARNAEVTLDRSVVTIPAMIAFKAEQTISGISLGLYNNNTDLNTATLKTAIAATMPGVGVNSIKEFQVSAGPTSAGKVSLRGIAIALPSAARVLSTDSVILNYIVQTYSALTAEQLQAQLVTAVNDGSFTTNLQSVATTNGATDLQGATSESIETQTIKDDSSEKTLSDGAIIGIAIGGFFGLVLIAGIVYYFACRSTK